VALLCNQVVPVAAWESPVVQLPALTTAQLAVVVALAVRVLMVHLGQLALVALDLPVL
jgi:uncharacterized protein (DUF934 family)